MKCFYLIIILFFTATSHAQWEPDVRLTNSPGTSVSSVISSAGNIIHVVWFDYRDENAEIYYKRSTNNGNTWQTDYRITNNSAESLSPSIAASENNIHIVWSDSRYGFSNKEIFYIKSTNYGVTWQSEIRLTLDPYSSLYPSVSVSGNNIHVIWEDQRDGGHEEIYYKKSTDNGVTWQTDTRLTNSFNASVRPSTFVVANNLHVVWQEKYNGFEQIYYKKSTDNGNTWQPDIILTNSSSGAYFPKIFVNGYNFHLVWYDMRNGSAEIYYKRSTDNGMNWQPDVRLTNSSLGAFLPKIDISGNIIHVVWYDWRDGNTEIYYKKSVNNGITWQNDVRLTNNNAASAYPSISSSGSFVHVVWYDDRDGFDEIYYKRDPTGNIIGIKTISSITPGSYYLYQNYPNPFNPQTKIKFEIPKVDSHFRGNDNVRLTIYNSLGQIVETQFIVSQPGMYEYEFDGKNYPSGVYFYKLTSGNYTDSKKMVLIK